MASSQFPKSPNKIDPVVPSAVASKQSLVWEGRNKKVESKRIIDDTMDYISNFTAAKLPESITKDVDIMASIEDKIYNYVNQSYVNMFNRYTITVEDEIMKKTRDFIDKEELKSLARYTPKDIVEIIDKIGGSDKFNTGEIEKSIVNMYGHLQGHIQRGVNDLENETNAILRQKSDVGMFVRGENAYSILKCSFKDSDQKPKTVYEVKLSINILDAELISPIFQYQSTVEYLLKDTLANHVTNLIGREIDQLKETIIDEGKAELTESEEMFEKVNLINEFTDDDISNPNSKRYSILAKSLIDKIEGLRAEIDADEYDALGIRENIKAIIDSENIRNRGFNTIVNTLTSILDTSKLGYQVADNKKNARDVFIREYEDENRDNLPDERYAIRLTFMDQDQIARLKKDYDLQISAFLREVEYIWETTHVLYEKKKKSLYGRKLVDFEDLVKAIMDKKFISKRDKDLSDPDAITWDNLQFRKALNTFVERNNRTYTADFKNISSKLDYIKKKLQDMYGTQNPAERVVIDERIDFLETQFGRFAYDVNPHHIQPGILLDIDVTTVKKKQYMLKQMANVLNEFLAGISKGFADAAFASFKRRRSTVRDDTELSFTEEENLEPLHGAAEYQTPSTPAGSSVPSRGASRASANKTARESSAAPAPSGENKVTGSADLTPDSASKGNTDDLGLKEL